MTMALLVAMELPLKATNSTRALGLWTNATALVRLSVNHLAHLTLKPLGQWLWPNHRRDIGEFKEGKKHGRMTFYS